MCFADDLFASDFIKEHSGELLILALTVLILVTLVILVPQLLRANARRWDLIHEERMRSLEMGFPLPDYDDRSVVAGRTAILVPMVVMITVGTVTCFLVAYKTENLFPVTLTAWVVAGVVSLAAITGGVALLGQLARIENGEKDRDEDDDGIPKYDESETR